MFVERLTEQDVLKFVSELNIKRVKKVESVNFFNEVNKWFVHLQMHDAHGNVCSHKLIEFTDFTILSGSLYVDKQKFKTFMYTKFGDEYKNAFNEQLKKKYEQELIK